MKLWYILKLMFHVIRGVITPTNLQHSVRAGAVLCESGLLKTTVEKIRSRKEGIQFFAEKNFDFNHGLKFFEKFPENPLGRSYYDHLVKYGLDPDAFPKVRVHDDASYVEHVIRHVHDLWHVLTGFDVSVNGELGLQAFKAKQLNWPFAMVGIGGGSFVTLFKAPQDIEGLMDQIARGSLMGAACKPLISGETTVKTTFMEHNITYQQTDFAFEPADSPA